MLQKSVRIWDIRVDLLSLQLIPSVDLHVEEFRAWVDQVSLGDIHDDEEIFLTDFGSTVHFDDCGHNLHELYFVDPCWHIGFWLIFPLCSVMVASTFVFSETTSISAAVKIQNINQYVYVDFFLNVRPSSYMNLCCF